MNYNMEQILLSCASNEANKIKLKLYSTIEEREKIHLTESHRYWVRVGIRFKDVSSTDLDAKDLIDIAILDMEKLQHIMYTLKRSSANGSSEEKKVALRDLKNLIMLRMARAILDQEKTKRVGCENAMREFLGELFSGDSVYLIKFKVEINKFIKLNSSLEESLSWSEWINDSGIAALKGMLLIMAGNLCFNKEMSIQGKIVGAFSLFISKIGVSMLERYSEKVFRGRNLSEATEVNNRNVAGVW